MELIISETRRKRDWYYLDGEYIAKECDVICARLTGKDLPNPELIMSERLRIRNSIPINQRGLYRVQPDPVTVTLWNDWQRRQGVGKAEIDN